MEAKREEARDLHSFEHHENEHPNGYGEAREPNSTSEGHDYGKQEEYEEILPIPFGSQS